MTQPTKELVCRHCGKFHGLRDEDAGTDREFLRLCAYCYSQVYKPTTSYLTKIS